MYLLFKAKIANQSKTKNNVKFGAGRWRKSREMSSMEFNFRIFILRNLLLHVPGEY